jgi:hypothetical protein
VCAPHCFTGKRTGRDVKAANHPLTTNETPHRSGRLSPPWPGYSHASSTWNPPLVLSIVAVISSSVTFFPVQDDWTASRIWPLWSWIGFSLWVEIWKPIPVLMARSCCNAVPLATFADFTLGGNGGLDSYYDLWPASVHSGSSVSRVDRPSLWCLPLVLHARGSLCSCTCVRTCRHRSVPQTSNVLHPDSLLERPPISKRAGHLQLSVTY